MRPRTVTPLIGVLAALWTSPAFATVTPFNKAATVNGTFVITDTTSVSVPSGAGVACAHQGQTAGTTLTAAKVTDSQGNTDWTIANSGAGQIDGTGANYAYIFYRPNFTSASNFTVTVNWGAAFNFLSLRCYVVSNMATSSVLLDTKTGFSAGSTTITTSANLTVTGTAFILASGVPDGGGVTSYGAYTGGNSSGNAFLVDAYHDGVTSSESPSFTQPSAGYGILAVALSESGGSPPPTGACTMALLGVGKCDE